MADFRFDDINNLITVLVPDTEVTVQELLNAIRNWEDELINLDVPKIANATGKDDLGGGVSVGITLKLLNWKVKFEARTGPDWVICNIRGGNLVAVDDIDDAMSPIEPSDYVTVTLTASSSATIAEGSGGSTPATIASAVWDKKTADHVVAGSFGEKVGKKLLTIVKFLGLK